MNQTNHAIRDAKSLGLPKMLILGTNREIGGVAPSVYLTKIENKGQVSSDILDTYLTTHWIDVVSCRNDNFQEHIIKRAKMLLNAIEKATGKSISGRDSEDVVNAFGGKLS